MFFEKKDDQKSMGTTNYKLRSTWQGGNPQIFAGVSLFNDPLRKILEANYFFLDRRIKFIGQTNQAHKHLFPTSHLTTPPPDTCPLPTINATPPPLWS